MADTRLLTVEDLAQFDEPGRYDLIKGELIQMPPAGGEHGRIALALGARIYAYVLEQNLGTTYAAETGFILDRQAATVLAPDVAFVRAGRLTDVEDLTGFLPVAPDLAVEIVSPSDRASQVQDKVLTYLEAGVRSVWIVDPYRRSVTVYAPDRSARLLVENETLTGGSVLPGFEIAVTDLFE